MSISVSRQLCINAPLVQEDLLREKWSGHSVSTVDGFYLHSTEGCVNDLAEHQQQFCDVNEPSSPGRVSGVFLLLFLSLRLWVARR